MTPLETAVEEWIAADVDPSSVEELRTLLARSSTDPDALAELGDRFKAGLQFGTAGLRGAMAAGPNRMNRAVVIRAAKGLIDYLSGHVDVPRVVIGNDARHHSREFALDTAGVVTAAGGQAYLLPDPVPTPVLAYAVRALNADAGVMVTASHNPAADNGYKVYLGGRMVPDNERGVQIVPPHDAQISHMIDAAPPANQIPRSEGWTDVDAPVVLTQSGSLDQPVPPVVLTQSGSLDQPVSPVILTQSGSPAPVQGLVHRYLEAISSGPQPGAQIKIVHTAMHGVGSPIALSSLARAGFTDVVSVGAQRDPDPDFPTVSFPNPEEPGAIDMAIALAKDVNADVVIANDPDADRCAVAVPDPRTGWRMLHGDELGAVLAEELAGTTGVFTNSVVSSRQLEVIASEQGRDYVRTLTGFKWMGRVKGLAYAYEEAIGYCVRPDIVRDKDGLSTAVLVAQLVSRLASQGKTIIDLLDDLARRHGLYLTSQLSVRCTDLSEIPQVMKRLRTHPLKTLVGSDVTQTIDLNQGWEGLPPTDGIMMITAKNDRVVVRPSGTEPKVKCYLEVVRPVEADASFDDLTEIRASARDRLDLIKTDLQKALF